MTPARTVNLLVVDDDPAISRFARAALESAGFSVTTVGSAEAALAQLDRDAYELVLSDVRMPGLSGVDLLDAIRQRARELPVVMMTAFASVDSAVEAMRRGATDYVVKPLQAEDLVHRIRRALVMTGLEAENRWLRSEVAAGYRPNRILAVSRRMRAVVETVEKLAASDVTVLIQGESGTGKELLARALHFGGRRADGPFVAINCAALPEALLESELFGSARGAFTGAYKDRPGKLEAADRGTLFLDEVGELPLVIQPKLLRALEERVVERVGESKPRRVDIRIVAATNRDLAGLVGEGRFRADLYYRLAVAGVQVPPLRERRDDIVPLARYLLRRFAGEECPELSEDALEALSRQEWPGNVRELANVLQRALALHDDGPIAAEELFGGDSAEPSRTSRASEAGGTSALVRLPPGGAPLDEMVRDLIVQALEASSWNQSGAALFERLREHRAICVSAVT